MAHGVGDARAAEAVFRDVLARDPQHLVARNNHAQLLGERECRAAAPELLDVGLALLPTTREHDQLAATREEILAAPGVPEPGDCPRAVAAGGIEQGRCAAITAADPHARCAARARIYKKWLPGKRRILVQARPQPVR